MITQPSEIQSSKNQNKLEIKSEISSSTQPNEEFIAQYLVAVNQLNEQDNSEIDLKETIKHLETIAKKGYDKAWMALGHYYMNTRKDTQKGIDYYRKAAENNFAEALYTLGKCCYNGFGVDKDYQKAFQYFQNAVEKGLVDANYYLGMCYCHGHGVEKSFILAADCFSKKYGTDFIDYIAPIGNLHETQDNDLDTKRQDKFLLHENAEIQLMLGQCYYYGVPGVNKNDEKAFECFDKAAEYGEISNTYSTLNLIGIQTQDDKIADRAFKAADKLEPNALSEKQSNDPMIDASIVTTFPVNKTDIQIALRRYHISKGFFRKSSKLSAAPIEALEGLLQNTSYFDHQGQLNAAGFNTLVIILLSTTQGRQSHMVLDKLRQKLGTRYTYFERLKELKLINCADPSKLNTLSDEILSALLGASDCLSRSKPSILDPSNFKLLYNAAFDENVRARLKFIPSLFSANMLNLENLKEILAAIPDNIAKKIEGYSYAVEQCEIPLPICLFDIPEAGTYPIENSNLISGRKQFFRDVPRGNSEARLTLIKKTPLPALLFSAFKQDDEQEENVSQARRLSQPEKNIDNEKKLSQTAKDVQNVLKLKSEKIHASIQYVIDNLGIEGTKELFLTYSQNYFSTIGMLMTPFIRYRYKDDMLPPPQVGSTVYNIDMAEGHLYVTCWNNNFLARVSEIQNGKEVIVEKQPFPNAAPNVIHEMQLVTKESKNSCDEYQFVQSVRTDNITLARDLFNLFCTNRLVKLQKAEKESKYSDKSEGEEHSHQQFKIDIYIYFSKAGKDVLNLADLLKCLHTLEKIPDDEQLTDLAVGYLYNNHRRSELLKQAYALLESIPIYELSNYQKIQKIINFLGYENSELSDINMQLQHRRNQDPDTTLNLLKAYHQKLLECTAFIAKINNNEETRDSLTDSFSTLRGSQLLTNSNLSRSSSFSYSGSGSSCASFFTGSQNTSMQSPPIATTPSDSTSDSSNLNLSFTTLTES